MNYPNAIYAGVAAFQIYCCLKAARRSLWFYRYGRIRGGTWHIPAHQRHYLHRFLLISFCMLCLSLIGLLNAFIGLGLF